MVTTGFLQFQTKDKTMFVINENNLRRLYSGFHRGDIEVWKDFDDIPTQQETLENLSLYAASIVRPFCEKYLRACIEQVKAGDIDSNTFLPSRGILNAISRLSGNSICGVLHWGRCPEYANAFSGGSPCTDIATVWGQSVYHRILSLDIIEREGGVINLRHWDREAIEDLLTTISFLPREGIYADFPPFVWEGTDAILLKNAQVFFDRLTEPYVLRNFLVESYENTDYGTATIRSLLASCSPALYDHTHLLDRVMAVYFPDERNEYPAIVECHLSGDHCFVTHCRELGRRNGVTYYIHNSNSTRYQLCDECSTVVNTREGNLCGDCCEQGYDEDEDCDRGELHEYSFKAEHTNRAFSSVDGEKTDGRTMFFGVELETATPNMEDVRAATEDNGIAFLCEDGSLTYGGFEIKTIPATLRWHYKHWRKMFEAMGGEGEHHTCGMHVHVSRKGLGALTVAKLVHLISTVGRDRQMKLFGRAFNSYCERPDRGITICQSDSRYQAMNVSGRRTVEFRMFASTTKRKVFIARLEMCAAMIRYCKETAIGNVHIVASEDKVNRTDFLTYVERHAKEYRSLYALIHGADKVREEEPGTLLIAKRKAKITKKLAA